MVNGDKILKKPVYDWHSLFKNGQEQLENWHSSRLAPSRNNENVTRNYAVMMSDKCMQWTDSEWNWSNTDQYWALWRFFRVAYVFVKCCTMHFFGRVDGVQEGDCCWTVWMIKTSIPLPSNIVTKDRSCHPQVLRQNISPPNGTPTCHSKRKSHRSENLSRMSCSSFFVTAWVWCTVSLSCQMDSEFCFLC